MEINQLYNVKGNNFYVNNYFGRNKIDLYQQAQRQLNMLTKILDKNPILHKEYGLRIVLALPYITKAKWKEKGFNRVTENKPVLFKDDFENIHMLRKYDKLYEVRK